MKPTQPPSSHSKIPEERKHQTPQMLRIPPFASISPSDIPTIQHNPQGCSRTAAAEQFHLHLHQAAIRTFSSPRTSTPDIFPFSNHETTSFFPAITSTYHNHVKIYPHFKLHQAFSLKTDITMIHIPQAPDRPSEPEPGHLSLATSGLCMYDLCFRYLLPTFRLAVKLPVTQCRKQSEKCSAYRTRSNDLSALPDL